MRHQLIAVDTAGVRWARQLPHPPLCQKALRGLSRITDHSDAWLAVALTGAALDARRRDQWRQAGSRIALVELTSQAIKRVCPRQRPQLEGLPHLAPTPSPMSFPSSHTAAAVAAVSAFRGLVSPSVLWVIAGTTAFSRLYLGVHFPSDVVAGALLGGVFASPVAD